MEQFAFLCYLILIVLFFASKLLVSIGFRLEVIFNIDILPTSMLLWSLDDEKKKRLQKGMKKEGIKNKDI